MRSPRQCEEKVNRVVVHISVIADFEYSSTLEYRKIRELGNPLISQGKSAMHT